MEQNCVKGYKVFYSDWSCGNDNGYYFKQYACPGTFEEDVVPKVCKRGMHFCEELIDCFRYYIFSPYNKVAEVVALGDIYTDGDKSCTNKLQIVRELSWDEVLKLVNTGNGNTGYQNIGNCNSGSLNEGNYNTGRHNEGDYNSGNNNRGNYNSGYSNRGNHNSGDWNTGNCNSGRKNRGDYNSGSDNYGDWNKSSCIYGCFNTKYALESNVFSMFNKKNNWNLDGWRQSKACSILNGMPQSRLTWIYFGDMTDEEKRKHLYAETTGGCLRMIEVTSDTRQQWWDTLPESDKKEIMSLPNFDADIFYEITDIRVN